MALAASTAAPSRSTRPTETSNFPLSFIPRSSHLVGRTHPEQPEPRAQHLPYPEHHFEPRAGQIDVLAHHAVLAAIVVAMEGGGEIQQVEGEPVRLELVRGRRHHVGELRD